MAAKVSLPKRVYITEVGPRDGLQMEQRILPTAVKIDLIKALAKAGIEAIQVGSFVHPGKVPQMADTREVIAGLADVGASRHSALTLNRKGVERACATPVPWIEVSLSASETQSVANSGMTVDKAMAEAAAMIDLARQCGRKIRGSIQCTFGCVDECEIGLDRVIKLVHLLLDKQVDMLVLADTTGMATPLTVDQVLRAVLPVTADTPLCLHLHDTRGLGLVNLMAGLQRGVYHFDTSLGGLGGCPFVKGAAGNIATEDTLHLLHSLNIQTGIDPVAVAHCSLKLSSLLGHSLSGKLYRLLTPSTAE